MTRKPPRYSSGESEADEPEDREQRQQRRDAGRRDRADAAARQRGRQPARAPHGGQHRADEQGHRVRVGAEVDTARVGRGRHALRDRDPGHRRGRDQGPEDRADPDAAGAPDLPEQPAQHRPHEVELLLHREGPQVLQHRRAARGLEVRLPVQHVPPVGGVEERRDRILLDPLGRVLRDRHRRDRRRHQHEVQRREQSPRSPDVEPLEVDLVARIELGQQQRGDQEARQREEHVDAQEPTRQPALVHVEHHDGEHRDRTHPVQPGHVHPRGRTVAPGCGRRRGGVGHGRSWEGRERVSRVRRRAGAPDQAEAAAPVLLGRLMWRAGSRSRPTRC